MRNMSFAMTTDQILEQSKTVTRRMGWKFLKAGDFVRPVFKCQGLKKGEKIQPLGPALEVVDVRRESLMALTRDLDYGFEECRLEGFGATEMRWPSVFVRMFCDANRCSPETEVTRIEFKYQEALAGPGEEVARAVGKQ